MLAGSGGGVSCRLPNYSTALSRKRYDDVELMQALRNAASKGIL